jgi:DNA-binding XRE family transcriptional regulator
MESKFRIKHGVGLRMREERLRLRLTQDELAQKLSVSRGTYLAYEKQLYPMDLTVVAQMPDAGLDVHYVLTGERRALAMQAAIPTLAFHEARAALKQYLLTQIGKMDPEKLDSLLLGIAISQSRSAIFPDTTQPNESPTIAPRRKNR